MNNNFSKNQSPSNDMLKAASNNAQASGTSTVDSVKSGETKVGTPTASPIADDGVSDKRDGKQVKPGDVDANDSPKTGTEKVEAPAATPTSR